MDVPRTHEHMTQFVIHILTKDEDDARALISVVYGQIFAVSTMLTTGSSECSSWGWQLTLAGLAIAPVFAFMIAVQSRISSLS